MSRDWEEQFRQWAKPPGKTEEERCENAVSAIRNAIKESEALRNRNVSIFLHGSYRNNTNVRADSDVDIGILCTDTFSHSLPEGTTPETFRIFPATYHYKQYKNEVEGALVGYFGRSAVSRSNKAFDVHETSYHVEADVAAFFEHRRYHTDGKYLTGVQLRTDRENQRVINWPEQHYDNGCGKNKTTGTRYKSVVRVLKKLSNEMADNGVRSANIPGFLVECLTWNVPDDRFKHPSYTDDVRAALVFLYNSTDSNEKCNEWGEASDLKYLFRPGNKWTREEANAFVLAAWQYVGFKS